MPAFEAFRSFGTSVASAGAELLRAADALASKEGKGSPKKASPKKGGVDVRGLLTTLKGEEAVRAAQELSIVRARDLQNWEGLREALG
eukprot:3217256-Prymnesium_polylepis.1